MSDYDPDALEEEAEGDYDIDYHGTIVGIEQGTKGDFIVDSDGNVAAANPSRAAIEVTVDTEAGDTISRVFSLPKESNPAASWRNPQFALGRFRDRYGQVPEPGMEVDITVNPNNGMLTIDID